MNSRKLIPMIVLGVIAAAAFVHASLPINSNDFWWHLKTGDYIRTLGEIPLTDPFTYLPAVDPQTPDRAPAILRQYWLTQVCYSVIHELWGVRGIIYTRAACAALLVVVIGAFLWRINRSYLALSFLLPMVLVMGVVFEDSDRPHHAAFVLFLLVFLLLESGIRSGRRWPLYLLPPVILLAAQLHPGFIASNLLIWLYAGCSFFEPRLRGLGRVLLPVAMLSTLAILLNPNGFALVFALFKTHGDKLTSLSPEFHSPLTIWRELVAPTWLAYWFFLLVSLPVCAVLIQRRHWSVALTLGGLAFLTLIAMRYVGFFGPVAAVIFGMTLALPPRRSIENIALGSCLVFAFLLIIFPGHPNRGRLVQLLKPGYFPAAAADFLAEGQGKDNLFNYIDWGGYLEYRLWPTHSLFADTRLLTTNAAVHYMEITNDTPLGRSLLQKYQVNTVILPSIDVYTGRIFSLVQRLSEDDGWSLVHYDPVALIFTKKPHALPGLAKELIWQQVLFQANAWRGSTVTASGLEQSRQYALARLRKG